MNRNITIGFFFLTAFTAFASPGWPSQDKLPADVSIDAKIVDGWGRNPWYVAINLTINNQSDSPVLMLNLATMAVRYEVKKKDDVVGTAGLEKDSVRHPDLNPGVTIGPKSTVILHLEVKRFDRHQKPDTKSLTLLLQLRYVLRAEKRFPDWPHGFEYISDFSFVDDERLWNFEP